MARNEYSVPMTFRRQRGSWPAAVAGALVLSTGCASHGQERQDRPAEEPTAKSSDNSVVIKTHRWATRLRSGDGVSLINEFGDLRVRDSGDSGLHYAAVMQQLDGESREAEFTSQRLPDELRIEVTAASDWRGRVDASARVPPGSPLDLRTANGLIEVRTSNNDVVARSRGGNVSIRTGGRIDARGESGGMLIVMLNTEFGDDPAGRIQTTMGDVELWLQPDANVTLHASAGGGIDVDAENSRVTIDNAAKNAEMSLGNGSAPLFVHTERGSLVVRILPDKE